LSIGPPRSPASSHNAVVTKMVIVGEGTRGVNDNHRVKVER
jgi:hypothetical protein